MLTQNELKCLFLCDVDSGNLIWNIQGKGKGRYFGEVAGTKDYDGYIRIYINKKAYKAHRLIWLYFYGVFPSIELDHINHNRADNRLENLREANQQENSRNSNKYKTNTSGYVGVVKVRNKWRAQITVNYKNICIGSFVYKQDAILARKKAEIEYKFHKNHGI